MLGKKCKPTKGLAGKALILAIQDNKKDKAKYWR
jgi:hypothetical protein